MQYQHPEHLARLPALCYARHPETGKSVLLKLGERGFFPAATVDPIRMNRILGVTPQQAAAMSVGSMFGFEVPGADPDGYTEAEALAMLTPPKGAAP